MYQIQYILRKGSSILLRMQCQPEKMRELFSITSIGQFIKDRILRLRVMTAGIKKLIESVDPVVLHDTEFISIDQLTSSFYKSHQPIIQDTFTDIQQFMYFTDGILSNMVKKNYQSEYARRARSDNLRVYGHHMRVSRRNIEQLSDTLRRALTVRSERESVRSEYGTIVPARLWKLGRSNDRKLFEREVKKDSSEFVVHVLIDASGSQRSRQGQVAIQAYILSESLSNVGIPHRVMSFCTFWDYTILHQFRDYDSDRKENGNIFEYITSSNNRDGLAIKAAGQGLTARDEEHKILIILSDGRPYDVILNRPNARNPQPYQGKYAVQDTGFEVRKLRNQGVCVLGVFAGEEKDLAAEKKIFGKDFAYIRNISGFSPVVGRYLMKQLEKDI